MPRFLLCAATLALAAGSILGTPAQAAPAPHGVVDTHAARMAGGWLTEQFFDQAVVQTKSNGSYTTDYAATADSVLGLDAAGVGQIYAENATLALFVGINTYVGNGTKTSLVEPLAKAILVAEAQRLNPRAFGGRDLVAALQALQNPSTGRFSDKSATGDHTDATSQSLAVIAERRAGSPQPVISNGLQALGELQCDNGSFAMNFGTSDCLTGNQLADNQATAMAILAGVDQTAHTPTWDRVGAAVTYLSGAQSEGMWTANVPGENPTKTTALAAAALAAVGVAGSATAPVSGALGAAQAVGDSQYSYTESPAYAGALGSADPADVEHTTSIGIFGLAIFDNPAAKISYETVNNDTADAEAPVPAVPTGSFQPMLPVRVLDTRPKSIAAGGTVVLHLPLKSNSESPTASGFPGSVTAVAFNVTAVTPAASGYLSIYPTGTPRPATSVLNMTAGITANSNTLTAVGADFFPGAISIYNGSNRPLQLILDATGFIQSGDGRASGSYRAVAPVRLVDTRKTARLKAGHTLSVGSPDQAEAVAVSITAVNPTASGYLTASGGPIPRPHTSTLNFVAGHTTTNGAIMALQGLSSFAVTNNSGGDVDVLVDMTGYFVAGRPILPGTYVPVGPGRLVDTRAGRPIPAYGVLALQTEGVLGMPDPGVAAIAANVTAVAPGAGGYLIVAPYGGVRPPPQVSTLNLDPPQTVAEGTLVGVGTDGAVAVYNASGRGVDVIVDVTGYFRSLAVSPS